jgi:DNA mismatch endonuclease (patch repair protein)
MLGNKRRDTDPELRLRKALHALGYRFRVDFRVLEDLNRRVDIAFTRRQVAVLVHGCYWHGCPQHYSAPRANAEFWQSKIARNIERDAETVARLSGAGWIAITIWEHQPLDEAVSIVTQVLDQRG